MPRWTFLRTATPHLNGANARIYWRGDDLDRGTLTAPRCYIETFFLDNDDDPRLKIFCFRGNTQDVSDSRWVSRQFQNLVVSSAPVPLDILADIVTLQRSPLCGHEDQSGYPACGEVATWVTSPVVNERLKQQPFYACDKHRKFNRWYSADSFTPIVSA